MDGPSSTRPSPTPSRSILWAILPRLRRANAPPTRFSIFSLTPCDPTTTARSSTASRILHHAQLHPSPEAFARRLQPEPPARKEHAHPIAGPPLPGGREEPARKPAHRRRRRQNRHRRTSRRLHPQSHPRHSREWRPESADRVVIQGRSLYVALLASVALGATSAPLRAQESALAADFRGEGDRFDQSCIHFSIGSCADLLFTDHPLHIAVGSLAPCNGFGSGLAFVTHYTPNENWRFYWDADAVATPNRSWRAGAYMTGVLIRHQKITITTGPATKKPSKLALQEMPVFHVYGQGISLNQIGYYGLGQGTPRTESLFGMTESIVGGNVVWPLWDALNLSLLGEVNGRFFSLRGSQTSTVPSLEQAGNESSAPGLINQPGYAQLGEGIRLSPSCAGGYVRLVYTAKFQQWSAAQSGYTL